MMQMVTLYIDIAGFNYKCLLIFFFSKVRDSKMHMIKICCIGTKNMKDVLSLLGGKRKPDNKEINKRLLKWFHKAT